MINRLFFLVPFIVFSFVTLVYAESPETEALKSKVEILEKQLQEIKDLLKQQMAKDKEKEKEIALLKEEIQEKKVTKEEVVTPYHEVRPGEERHLLEESYLYQKAVELERKKLAPSFGGIYTKPFLRRFGRNTYLGGYFDFEYWASEDEGGNHGFDQHRFIPFIYSDVSDRVKLAAEIEFEHGGVEGGRDGEVVLEFATMDFLVYDWLNLRGGFILSPLGRFNLIHDSPLQDLTDRPLVDQLIIPTTLTETGMGFFGTLYPTELSKLDYEIYVTNGAFDNGLSADGTSNFSLKKGIRSSRGGFKFDDNESPGVVGRVAFSPFLGLEFGGSFNTSRYDEKNNNRMTIGALDFLYQRGAFEILGEGAYAFIDTDSFAEDAGITDDMWGYYLEARYHFLPSFLRTRVPQIFTENSTFTGVLRWGQVQTAGLDAGEKEHWLRTRITPGINYRYTEDSVFKLEYHINLEQKEMPDLANNSLVFSMTTYF